MILVDTSVWVDFFKGRTIAQYLTNLLESWQVVIHPFVLVELNLGHFGKKQNQILEDLEYLPSCSEITFEEILAFIQKESLMTSGIGLVDTYLLYSALVEDHLLWTFDQKLQALAKKYHAHFLVPL